MVGKPLPMAAPFRLNQVLGARQPGKHEEIHAGRADESHVLQEEIRKQILFTRLGPFLFACYRKDSLITCVFHHIHDEWT